MKKEVFNGDKQERKNHGRDGKGQGQNQRPAGPAELEQKHKEAENEEIVDIVRGMSISLEELPLVLQRIKAGDALGQNVPKSAGPEKEDAE